MTGTSASRGVFCAKCGCQLATTVPLEWLGKKIMCGKCASEFEIKVSKRTDEEVSRSIAEHAARLNWHPALNMTLGWFWSQPKEKQSEANRLIVELSAKLYDLDAKYARASLETQ